LAVVLAASCGGEPAEAHEGDGTLILELGGDHQPLRTALAASDPNAPSPEDPRAEEGGGGEARPPNPDQPNREGPNREGPNSSPNSSRAERGGPESAAPLRTVVLGRGETLYSLAVHHLDDGKRWREILALNGWTEAQVGGLAEGTVVRLPAR